MAERFHPVYEIAQFIADGEPTSPSYYMVRFHLAQCAACRNLATRLRQVEADLKSCPAVAASPILRPNIARIIAETQASIPSWQPMPLTVWVPLAAIIAATISTLLLVPDASGTAAMLNWEQPVVVLPEMMASWLQSFKMQLNPDALLTIGGALATILGGAGFVWALSALSPEQSRQLGHISNQVTDRANHLLHKRSS